MAPVIMAGAASVRFMSQSRIFRAGVEIARDVPVEQAAKYAAEPDACVWLDLCAPAADELAAVGEAFDLHELAVEHATHQRQRPKLDRYDGHLFLNGYAVRLDPATMALETTEVSAFILPNALIMVRKSAGCELAEIQRRWAESAELAGHGVPYLLYGLLDYLLDTHSDAALALDDAAEDVEDTLFDERDGARLQRKLFALRRAITALRRVALPMREVVGGLTELARHTVPEPLRPYYRDLADHVLRVDETVEATRELIASMLDTSMNMQANRLNQIMKKLTGWAAIIAVPTAITGIYGQNVPVPGLNRPLGLYVSSGLIVALFIALYALFRRRDWL